MNVRSSRRRCGWAWRFVVLIFRDDGYGVIRWKQERQFGRDRPASSSGNPDFVALARAFGCEGVTISGGQGSAARARSRADRPRARC